MSMLLDDINVAPWAQIASEKVVGAGWPYVSFSGRNVWVDSALGSNSTGSGTRSAPFATVAYALTKAIANDVILVKPGHAETLASAGALLMNVPRVRIQGLGYSDSRPTFTWTTANVVGTSVDITAANCAIHNCIFTVGASTREFTAMFNIKVHADTVQVGSGFRFIGNRVVFRTANGGAVQIFLTDGTANSADGLHIESNVFYGSANANTLACVNFGAAYDRAQIIANNIIGSFHATTGVILDGANVGTGLNIDRNQIYNRTSNASAKIVVLAATTSGFVTNNRFQIIGGGAAPVTGAAMVWEGNYYAGAIATSGTLL